MDIGGEKMQSKEFQGVILAGTGRKVLHKLEPLVNESKSPKALLPLANKPLLFYQLEWFESAMINDIMIVSPEEGFKKISSYVHNVLNVAERYPNAKVEVIKAKGNPGSADGLRHVANRIKTDFIVMCCDTITNYPASKLLDVFRIQSPTFVSLFHDTLENDTAVSKKSLDDESVEYVAIDHSTCRLLYTVGWDDVDEVLPVRMSMLDKFPVVNIHTKLRDAHLYVFKHWVIDFVAKSKFQSIRRDLIPLLTHYQYSETALKRDGIDKYLTSPFNFDPFYTARLQSSSGGGFVNASHSQSLEKHYQKVSQLSHLALQQTTPSSTASSSILLDDHETHNGIDSDFHKSVVCTAIVAKEGYTFRVNNVSNYLEGSRAFIKTVPGDDLVPRSVERQKGCQVGDSMIGDSARIGEKTGIKKCIIGNHCVIGKNVKIINSIIMDHCTIEDKVVLEGTVVSSYAKVLEMSSLKDCLVAAHGTVEKETQAKNEHFE